MPKAIPLKLPSGADRIQLKLPSAADRIQLKRPSAADETHRTPTSRGLSLRGT
jgi:hypothetical protein